MTTAAELTIGQLTARSGVTVSAPAPHRGRPLRTWRPPGQPRDDLSDRSLDRCRLANSDDRYAATRPAA